MAASPTPTVLGTAPNLRVPEARSRSRPGPPLSAGSTARYSRISRCTTRWRTPLPTPSSTSIGTGKGFPYPPPSAVNWLWPQPDPGAWRARSICSRAAAGRRPGPATRRRRSRGAAGDVGGIGEVLAKSPYRQLSSLRRRGRIPCLPKNAGLWPDPRRRLHPRRGQPRRLHPAQAHPRRDGVLRPARARTGCASSARWKPGTRSQDPGLHGKPTSSPDVASCRLLGLGSMGLSFLRETRHSAGPSGSDTGTPRSRARSDRRGRGRGCFRRQPVGRRRSRPAPWPSRRGS